MKLKNLELIVELIVELETLKKDITQVTSIERHLLIHQPIEHAARHQQYSGEPLILPAPKGAYRIHFRERK